MKRIIIELPDMPNTNDSSTQAVAGWLFVELRKAGVPFTKIEVKNGIIEV